MRSNHFLTRLAGGAAGLAALTAPAIAAEKSLDDFAFLIGEWEGRSTFLFEREEGREPVHEDVRATCGYILKKTYIQCDTQWTRDGDGRKRTFRVHFNYNALDETHQILFLYDNWPRHFAYPLKFDETENAFVGLSTFENSDGVEGNERVLWSVSQDGNEVRSREYNHLATDPEDYYAQSFEFIWRRAK